MSIAPDLRVEGLSKAFAGLKALSDISVVVEAGELVGLIGPNGAGKTTLFNCIVGLIPADTGATWLGDVRLDGRRPEKIADLGVVRTFQTLRMFPRLTVLESLLAAKFIRRKTQRDLLGEAERSKWRRFVNSTVLSKAEGIMELLSLEEVANKPSGEVGLLVQRKVELGRALMTEPQVLLLDEPSAGATDHEAEELRTIVDSVSQTGISVFLVEHNIPFVMSLATKIIALNFGRIIATGTPKLIRDDPEVRRVYLGS